MKPQSNQNSQNLQNLETQLQELLERDKRNWTKTAQLLIEIEHQELFLKRAKSFSQYIRQLAEQFKIHESNFWRIKKAGEYYLKLNDTTNVKVISDAKTTPEQVEILTKISTVAPPEVVKALEEKMINGETTRQELRDIWKAYRPAKEGKTERGRKPKTPPPNDSNASGDLLSPISPVASVSPVAATGTGMGMGTATNTSPVPQPSSALKSPPPAQSQSAKAVLAITAANIVTALRSPQWVIETFKSKDIKSIKEINYMRLFQEVAITVGSSHHARRIDVVAIVRETYKSPLPTVLGVEIKTSVNDLLRDQKLTEYLSFCHYFYLAIPNERAFIEAAESVTTPSIGLLTLTDKLIDGQYQLIVNRKARRLQPHPAILGELYGKCLFHALGFIGKEEEEL